jgi:hypothetical protein
MENIRVIPKGAEILNEDGSLYCTFMKEYIIGEKLCLDHIQYSDGSKPVMGQLFELKVSNFISEFSVG